MTKLLLFVLLTTVCCCSPRQENSIQEPAELNIPFTGRSISGREYAVDQVRAILNDSVKPWARDTMIQNSQTAIAVAEPILFDIYGKEQIVDERPYEIYMVDGYWFITGTLPKGWKGGTFELIMDSKDGKIVSLVHYK